jgi:glycosyltransferase involved in cell wall biosynthesis
MNKHERGPAEAEGNAQPLEANVTEALVADSHAHSSERLSSAPATKPRQIVMMVSHYPAGGAQEIMADIGHGLAVKNAGVKLLALYPLADPPKPGEDDWSCVVQTKPKSVFGLLRLAWTLLRKLRESSPDAVISALPAANIAAIFGAALAAPKARVIITHHSPIQTHNKVFTTIDSWLGAWRNVSAIVSVSDAVGESLKEKPAAYRAKCRTIRNALPPRIEKALAELVEKRGERTSIPRTVIATGRLSRQKNYPVLLRAATHLRDVKILIVGGGADMQSLKALAQELKVEDKVEFLGHKPREEALALLANGGIFAQPSLFEGHSLALVEAAKLHLPLIVSNVPEQVEAITMADGAICGMLVDPADDRGLAEAISRTLDDPDAYRQWCAKSKALADSLRYDDMIAAYEELLR